MQPVPQDLLKEYVQSQHYTSTTEIMEAMKEMFRDVIQTVMEVEMDKELGRERCERSDEPEGTPRNYRNGYTKKTVKPQLGEVDIKVPRDRNGSFEPKIIGKYDRNADGIEDKILALYACGMSQRDIAEQIKELYGVEISPELVTKISEKIMPEVTAWQNRPLESVYPFVFMDAIHYKVREDRRYVTKAAYVVLGVTVDGRKDILGVWIGEHENSKFWLNVLNDLKSRGVLDVYLFCTDGLCGMMQAIEAVFPKSRLQRCIVHQVRSSTRYVSYKDIKKVVADLKKVYSAVTLEEACTAVLKLMGYKMTDLSGAFPNAQLNKASEIGLRAGLDRRQGEAMNYEDCAVLLYNALTANNASGSAYGTTLGFTVSNGQVDGSTILLSSLKGPFVASESTVLPFVPASVYRNDKVSGSAELNKYDVYYYSESLKTLWVYTRRAAGRITEVSPSASAPASITVAGTSYTLGSTAIASQVSSLNGGGVGQVVTLLLGMNNVAAGIITGEEADEVFYGVVQSSARNLIDEDNSADVLQTVKVLCTDGLAREVNVDKSLNFPTGWLVEVRVSPEGESVEKIDERSVSGTVNENATALGDMALADDVQILDTSTGGVAGFVPAAYRG